MYLPRASEETDVCPPEYASCIPSAAGAMPGSNSPIDQQPDSKNFDQTDFTKPGPHRYIGIGMVAGMALLVLVLWVCLGRWPRRMMEAHGCCGRRKSGREENWSEGSMSAREKWHEGSLPRGRQKSRDVFVPCGPVITEPARVKEGKRSHFELNWELERVRAVSLQERTLS
ncbi:hypothetical protein K443DRAFT_673833 [Laccaria amethystina LaAM-08-1]|uniref:Uncharacterized protein n=1 Tax=Laccaria amethystina LaAM-08-1 TaxID=1095629 RepID=A0A0C9X468_9AGAR|nr:hypothetical protein K443DRAFT_673833 [Laccaria amethystina LaAM-08-1]